MSHYCPLGGHLDVMDEVKVSVPRMVSWIITLSTIIINKKAHLGCSNKLYMELHIKQLRAVHLVDISYLSDGSFGCELCVSTHRKHCKKNTLSHSLLPAEPLPSCWRGQQFKKSMGFIQEKIKREEREEMCSYIT